MRIPWPRLLINSFQFCGVAGCWMTGWWWWRWRWPWWPQLLREWPSWPAPPRRDPKSCAAAFELLLQILGESLRDLLHFPIPILLHSWTIRSAWEETASHCTPSGLCPHSGWSCAALPERIAFCPYHWDSICSSVYHTWAVRGRWEPRNRRKWTLRRQ